METTHHSTKNQSKFHGMLEKNCSYEKIVNTSFVNKNDNIVDLNISNFDEVPMTALNQENLQSTTIDLNEIEIPSEVQICGLIQVEHDFSAGCCFSDDIVS